MLSTMATAALGWLEGPTSGCVDAWLVWKHTNDYLFNKGMGQPSLQNPECPKYSTVLNNFLKVTFQS